MTSAQYVDMLHGNGWKYRYNETTLRYKKEYLNGSEFMEMNISDIFLQPSDIIIGTHNTHYGDEENFRNHGEECESKQEHA